MPTRNQLDCCQLSGPEECARTPFDATNETLYSVSFHPSVGVLGAAILRRFRLRALQVSFESNLLQSAYLKSWHWRVAVFGSFCRWAFPKVTFLSPACSAEAAGS